jgi:hypothetical protein
VFFLVEAFSNSCCSQGVSRKSETRNSKWFDWPFDWLTILSEAEGQYQMTKTQNQKMIMIKSGEGEYNRASGPSYSFEHLSI